MKQTECSSVKESLLLYLAEMTDVSSNGKDCVITVPFQTFDERWVDVTVEDEGNDFFVVHDGGKSADELFLQGMPITDARTNALQLIASRFGVQCDDGKFLVGCKRDFLQHSIWTIANCSSLAMSELIRHRTSVDEEPVKSAVGSIIMGWGLVKGVRVEPAFRVLGNMGGQHTFDFVARNLQSTVAVNVLNPTSGALSRAERYGYQSLDLEGTAYGSWKKLAVIANRKIWSEEALRIVSKCSNGIVDYVNANGSRDFIVSAIEEMMAA
jgi:hypothetical protein